VEQKPIKEQEVSRRCATTELVSQCCGGTGGGNGTGAYKEQKRFRDAAPLRFEQEGSGTEADKGTRGFATLRHLSRVEKKESRTDCGFDDSSVKMTNKYPQTMFLTTVT